MRTCADLCLPVTSVIPAAWNIRTWRQPLTRYHDTVGSYILKQFSVKICHTINALRQFLLNKLRHETMNIYIDQLERPVLAGVNHPSAIQRLFSPCGRLRNLSTF